CTRKFDPRSAASRIPPPPPPPPRPPPPPPPPPPPRPPPPIEPRIDPFPGRKVKPRAPSWMPRTPRRLLLRHCPRIRRVTSTRRVVAPRVAPLPSGIVGNVGPVGGVSGRSGHDLNHTESR